MRLHSSSLSPTTCSVLLTITIGLRHWTDQAPTWQQKDQLCGADYTLNSSQGHANSRVEHNYRSRRTA